MKPGAWNKRWQAGQARILLENRGWAVLLLCVGVVAGLWLGTGSLAVWPAARATTSIQPGAVQPPVTLALEHYLLLNQPGPLWLRKMDLRDFDLQGIELRGVDFSAAVLRRTNLQAALLVNANLDSADLEGANLRQAVLTNARMTGANLRNAKLDFAALDFADLRSADLTGAILVGANLSGADLTDANLAQVHYDDATVWPEGFTPPTLEDEAAVDMLPGQKADENADDHAEIGIETEADGASEVDIE